MSDLRSMTPPTFATGSLPPGFEDDAGTYRKTALTRALRIDGPFRVETSEGPLDCADGYLAVDARGYPYPIATDEFVKIYEPDDDEDIEGGLIEAVAELRRDFEQLRTDLSALIELSTIIRENPHLGAMIPGAG